MIFISAADDVTPVPAPAADDTGDDATVDGDAAGDDIAEGDGAGEASALAAEVVGPLDGGVLLGSVIVGDVACDDAWVEVGVAVAALPLPAVELQPVNSTAAAARQSTSMAEGNVL